MDYTDLYNFVSQTGVIVPSARDIKAEIEERYREIFGADVDVSPETIVGRLIEKDAVFVRSALGVTAQNANQFSIENSTGECLDAIGQIFSVRRLTATRTVVPITVELTSETVRIPAGVKMMDDDGNLFTVNADILPSSSGHSPSGEPRYYGKGFATADEAGPIPGDAGTITTVQTSILGWVGVSNDAAISVGSYVETDADFRQRIKGSRSIGVGFEEALVSSLKRMEGVRSVRVENNDDYYRKMMNGVDVPGHTVFVCVDADSAVDEEVAKTVLRSMTAGVALMHNPIEGTVLVEKDVPYGSSVPRTAQIKFYRPANLAVRVWVKVNARFYTGASAVEAVRDSVLSHIANLGIGDAANSTMIASRIMDDHKSVGVIDIRLATEEDERIERTSVEAFSFQKIVVRRDDIAVEEV